MLDAFASEVARVRTRTRLDAYYRRTLRATRPFAPDTDDFGRLRTRDAPVLAARDQLNRARASAKSATEYALADPSRALELTRVLATLPDVALASTTDTLRAHVLDAGAFPRDAARQAISHVFARASLEALEGVLPIGAEDDPLPLENDEWTRYTRKRRDDLAYDRHFSTSYSDAARTLRTALDMATGRAALQRGATSSAAPTQLMSQALRLAVTEPRVSDTTGITQLMRDDMDALPPATTEEPGGEMQVATRLSTGASPTEAVRRIAGAYATATGDPTLAARGIFVLTGLVAPLIAPNIPVVTTICVLRTFFTVAIPVARSVVVRLAADEELKCVGVPSSTPSGLSEPTQEVQNVLMKNYNIGHYSGATLSAAERWADAFARDVALGAGIGRVAQFAYDAWSATAEFLNGKIKLFDRDYQISQEAVVANATEFADQANNRVGFYNDNRAFFPNISSVAPEREPEKFNQFFVSLLAYKDTGDATALGEQYLDQKALLEQHAEAASNVVFTVYRERSAAAIRTINQISQVRGATPEAFEKAIQDALAPWDKVNPFYFLRRTYLRLFMRPELLRVNNLRLNRPDSPALQIKLFRAFEAPGSVGLNELQTAIQANLGPTFLSSGTIDTSATALNITQHDKAIEYWLGNNATDTFVERIGNLTRETEGTIPPDVIMAASRETMPNPITDERVARGLSLTIATITKIEYNVDTAVQVASNAYERIKTITEALSEGFLWFQVRSLIQSFVPDSDWIAYAVIAAGASIAYLLPYKIRVAKYTVTAAAAYEFVRRAWESPWNFAVLFGSLAVIVANNFIVSRVNQIKRDDESSNMWRMIDAGMQLAATYISSKIAANYARDVVDSFARLRDSEKYAVFMASALYARDYKPSEIEFEQVPREGQQVSKQFQAMSLILRRDCWRIRFILETSPKTAFQSIHTPESLGHPMTRVNFLDIFDGTRQEFGALNANRITTNSTYQQLRSELFAAWSILGGPLSSIPGRPFEGAYEMGLTGNEASFTSCLGQDGPTFLEEKTKSYILNSTLFPVSLTRAALYASTTLISSALIASLSSFALSETNVFWPTLAQMTVTQGDLPSIVMVSLETTPQGDSLSTRGFNVIRGLVTSQVQQFVDALADQTNYGNPLSADPPSLIERAEETLIEQIRTRMGVRNQRIFPSDVLFVASRGRGTTPKDELALDSIQLKLSKNDKDFHFNIETNADMIGGKPTQILRDISSEQLQFLELQLRWSRSRSESDRDALEKWMRSRLQQTLMETLTMTVALRVMDQQGAFVKEETGDTFSPYKSVIFVGAFNDKQLYAREGGVLKLTKPDRNRNKIPLQKELGPIA